jgi:putative ABC transport system substrate-binding protein
MKRRRFIGVLGATVLFPRQVLAQRPDHTPRVGVLAPLNADDPALKASLSAFSGELRRLGWVVGKNLTVDSRVGAGEAVIRKNAEALLALKPDVILAIGGTVVAPLLQLTSSVPVVFTQTPDPVSSGYVASMSRPGRNATGFTLLEFGLSGKWLELLKSVAPATSRAAIVRDPATPEGASQYAVIESVAPTLGIELTSVDVRDAGELERSLAAFATAPNGGMVVTASGLANVHRELIVTLAARHRLPAIYFRPIFAPLGGLICYGPGLVEPHRLAAGYVDRILKGEKPGDLPVQAPTRYSLVINLKTAKTLGLLVPPTLLVSADEVIE